MRGKEGERRSGGEEERGRGGGGEGRGGEELEKNEMGG